jgi:hypothetical protein
MESIELLAEFLGEQNHVFVFGIKDDAMPLEGLEIAR